MHNGFIWARVALSIQKRRSPARAVVARTVTNGAAWVGFVWVEPEPELEPAPESASTPKPEVAPDWKLFLNGGVQQKRTRGIRSRIEREIVRQRDT